jgi:hypothetical protein
MTNYVMVLATRFYGSQYSIDGNDYDTLVWESDTPKPTQEELDAMWSEVQYENQCAIVDQQRLIAYEKQSDPIFFKWQRGDATEQEWLDAVQAVKDQYPYPTV